MTVSDIGSYDVVLSNVGGSVTSAPVLLSVDDQLTFRILALQTNGVISLEHNAATGDDRGGLVVAPDYVYVTGDNSTARFSASQRAASLASPRRSR